MALKNTYSKSPASQSILAVQNSLVKAGATGIMYEYLDGRIIALKFQLSIKENKVSFALPVNVKKVQRVLEKERIGRWQDDDYVYRVSWAILRDWVDAQMAILQTETVEMAQIFLPFALGKDGKTLYENVVSGGFLLGDGK